MPDEDRAVSEFDCLASEAGDVLGTKQDAPSVSHNGRGYRPSHDN